jgi:hypothetical protein
VGGRGDYTISKDLLLYFVVHLQFLSYSPKFASDSGHTKKHEWYLFTVYLMTLLTVQLSDRMVSA